MEMTRALLPEHDIVVPAVLHPALLNHPPVLYFAVAQYVVDRSAEADGSPADRHAMRQATKTGDERVAIGASCRRTVARAKRTAHVSSTSAAAAAHVPRGGSPSASARWPCCASAPARWPAAPREVRASRAPQTRRHPRGVPPRVQQPAGRAFGRAPGVMWLGEPREWAAACFQRLGGPEDEHAAGAVRTSQVPMALQRRLFQTD